MQGHLSGRRAAVGMLVLALIPLAGTFSANAAVQAQPASASPAKEAYVIFMRERTRDTAELKTYSEKAPASLAGQPATLLAVYGRQEMLEGAATEGVVILRFPSFSAAKAWYDGPVYREARKHRFAGADYRAVIVEGR